MNAGWRIVDCTNSTGSIKYRRGQIIVNSDENGLDIAIPLAQVAVVLIGIQTSVSGAVITKLSEYDIALLVCDWREVPIAGAIPWREHTRIGVRHRSQADLSLPRKKKAWAAIVQAKILGQAHTLQLLGHSGCAELSVLAKRVRSGDPENIEARAARKYWQLISGETKFSRLPGSETLGWNSALDYGYTLLRGYGIRAVTSAGLSGALGVFHRGRGNAFALVDDLMEPFRGMVDAFVFSELSNDEPLTKEAKHYLSSSLNSTLDSSGKSLPTVFTDFAHQYGLYVEGKSESLVVPKWKGSLHASEGI